jgi:YidC/Oxa1 family membrane protein insertase
VGGHDLWICDLAAHDPTYVLPILMGVSMFIQQKMTPVMGDPRQAKIMLMMPLLFTFMFLSLPSGLVLYWTLSNVLQIAQQYYMDRWSQAARVPARATKKA